MANEIGSGQELNATQLDAQRARNLLDRALGMSERSDIAGALVTCRQSLALSPHSPQGWSMLGLLSERDGDIHGAIEAYEKTLQLSPTSVYERESLQRLRQKRGAAPRPAPKFNFDEIRAEQPQLPIVPVPTPVVPKPISVVIPPEPLVTEASKSFSDTFYFRSLPLLIAAVLCLGVILVAQRVAANRQIISAQVLPAPPVNVDPNTAATADTTAQPAAPQITPNTLAPPETPAAQPTPTTSSETVAPGLDQATSAPLIPPSKPKAAAKSKPKTKAAVPSEMPVLPRPRLTLPNRTSSTTAVSDTSATDKSSDNAPSVGGGPVDVGNSNNSKYVPITPPRFPNASRE